MPSQSPTTESPVAGPSADEFHQDVLDGLRESQKTLPCKYLYDERGSQLFEQICRLDEYYPTRTELQIMEDSAGEIAELLGPDCLLVEYGSGSSVKTRLLLEVMRNLVAYVPVDISADHLEQCAAELQSEFPEVPIVPVAADFTEPIALDEAWLEESRRTVVFFPGSTIGNFEPDEAVALLQSMHELAGDDGALLIGVDLWKQPDILAAAYNDAQGVTAQFNLNLLERINRELDAEFDLDRFRHEARVNADRSRVEMHLVSDVTQEVRVNGAAIPFARGESIHTENSHKYRLEEFQLMAESAGFRPWKVWTDPEELFSVQLLRA